MEVFGNQEIKLKPTDEPGKILSHGEKIEQAGEGYNNIFKIRGMLNKDGEVFSTIATKKAADELTLSGLEDRRF